MVETKLSILFYSKTAKTTKEGLVPIYLRVTINGSRFEQSTQRYVLPADAIADRLAANAIRIELKGE